MVVLSFSLQKLEFLQCGEFTRTPPPYFIDLSRLLGSTKVTTDDIFEWIEVYHVFVHSCWKRDFYCFPRNAKSMAHASFFTSLQMFALLEKLSGEGSTEPTS